MVKELSNKTIMAWRQFSATEAFEEGVQYLRREGAPKRKGTDVPAMLEHASAWGAYQEALDDLSDMLTQVPKVEKSLDEPPLNG